MKHKKEFFIIVKKKNFVFDMQCFEEMIRVPIFNKKDITKSLTMFVQQCNELMSDEHKIIDVISDQFSSHWGYIVSEAFAKGYLVYHNTLVTSDGDLFYPDHMLIYFIENFENDDVKVVILDDLFLR